MLQQLNLNEDLFYTIFTVYVSSVALLTFNLTQFRKKRNLLTYISQYVLSSYEDKNPQSVQVLTTLLVITEIVLISLFQHGLVSPINWFFGDLMHTGANYFGMIIAMPILLPIFCWLIGVDPFKQIDLITPAYPLALVFMKVGCFFAGCCNGITCKFGVYNIDNQQTEVPIQLIEAIIALFMFFFLLQYRKKAKEGTLLPTYIILYCGTRLFSEFLRSDPNIIWIFKQYQILCLFGLLYGIVQLLVINKYKDSIRRIYRKPLPYLLLLRRHL